MTSEKINPVIGFIQQRQYILLGLLLLVFTGLKFNDMFLPYFWDEMGVYAGAALYLFDHSMSLMPGALPPDLSRGHPTLLVFLVACCFKILGTSTFIGHLLPMIFSLSLLVAVYYFNQHFFNPLIAIISVVLLMSMPIFYAQSTLILPEMPLALLGFLAAGFYLQKRWWLYGIAAGMAVLVKETGIIIPLVIFVFHLLRSIRHQSAKTILTESSVILAPLFVFGLFLIIQKIQNGWYLFPYHVGFIDFEPQVLKYKRGFFYLFLFKDQGRNIWGYTTLMAILFLIVRRKDTQVKEWIRKWKTPVLMYGFLGGSLFLSLMLSPDMKRYSLIIMPFFLTITVMAAYLLFYKWPVLLGIHVVALLVINCYHMEDGRFTLDVDMDFRPHFGVMQDAVQFMEANGMHDKKVHSNFPMYFALQDRRFGYLRKHDRFLANMPNDKHNEFIALYKVLPDQGEKIDTNDYQLLQFFSSSSAIVEIYQSRTAP